MTEDPIPRDRHAITEDIADVHIRVGHAVDLLRGGTTAEELVNLPGLLSSAATELERLAHELEGALHWTSRVCSAG